MAITIRVKLGHYQQWRKALDERLRAPRKILNQIGGILVATSQRSFRQQRLGSFVWPARYPNQSGLKLNIAGAVSDLAKGPTIKARRFQDRPALTDAGLLRKSVTFRLVGGDTVEAGSNLPYASAHQGGGRSVISITDAIRKNLSTYLKREGGRTRKAEKGPVTKKSKGNIVSTVAAPAMRFRLSAIRRRLGFLFKVKTLATKINRRPFVGIDDETEKKIIRTVERDLPLGIPR